MQNENIGQTRLHVVSINTSNPHPDMLASGLLEFFQGTAHLSFTCLTEQCEVII